MRDVDRPKSLLLDRTVFEQVVGSERQIEILYGLLTGRKNYISHKPGSVSFASHREFVLNHPYRDWRIVVRDDFVLGAIYLSFQNAIGLNFIKPSFSLTDTCLEFVTSNFEPLTERSSVRAGKFHINVSASDHEMMTILVSLGWAELQRTFVAG